jgi:hypothetical protein
MKIQIKAATITQVNKMIGPNKMSSSILLAQTAWPFEQQTRTIALLSGGAIVRLFSLLLLPPRVSIDEPFSAYGPYDHLMQQSPFAAQDSAS